MTAKDKAPPRQHITTTLPLDLIAMLDAYVATKKVKRNAVVETALLRFFLQEEKGKGKT